MRRHLGSIFWAFLVVTLSGGCTETGTTSSNAPDLVACAPLSAVEQPITLGTVVAVGRDAAGTLYVVDHFDTDYRVFQSNGTELMLARQTGSGMGSAGDGSEFMGFTVESPVDGTVATIAVNIASGVVRMAFAPSAVQKSNFELTLAAGVELEVLDATAVAGLSLRNLPGEIVVEYHALTSDGDERLLVTRPRDNWFYTDFRLFYGEGDTLAECDVIEVIRFRDGGTTTIRFELDGAEATALFPASITGTADPPTLTRSEGVVALNELGQTAALDVLTFTCLEP